jgi:hypothetical protein
MTLPFFTPTLEYVTHVCSVGFGIHDVSLDRTRFGRLGRVGRSGGGDCAAGKMRGG